MKRNLIGLCLLLVVGAATAALVRVGGNPFRGPADVGNGWGFTIYDSDIDNAWELVRQDDKAFTQLTTSGKVIAGTNHGDTLVVYVSGVDSASQAYRDAEQLIVKAGVRDTVSAAYYAIEAAWLDTELASGKVCSLFTFGGVLMNTIGATGTDHLHASPAQRIFDAKETPVLLTFQAGINGSTAVEYQVRVYDSISAIRDAADSFTIPAGGRLYCTSNAPVQQFTWPAGGLKVSDGSVVQVWAKAASNNATGWVSLTGGRRR